MERKRALFTVGAVAVGIAAIYFGYRAYRCLWMIDGTCTNKSGGGPNQAFMTENGVDNQNQTQTPDDGNPSLIEPVSTGQYLLDPDTNTRFDIVNLNGTTCIKLRQFTENDWQDVFRATKNLGSSQESYTDLPASYVYNPDLSFLGTVYTTAMPSNSFDIVQIGTFICEQEVVFNQ